MRKNLNNSNLKDNGLCLLNESDGWFENKVGTVSTWQSDNFWIKVCRFANTMEIQKLLHHQLYAVGLTKQ